MDNALPVLRDAGLGNGLRGWQPNRVQVSEDSTNNTLYEGYALYQVYTNDDGSVELEGTRRGTDIIGLRRRGHHRREQEHHYHQQRQYR